jgi:hypothetical protein
VYTNVRLLFINRMGFDYEFNFHQFVIQSMEVGWPWGSSSGSLVAAGAGRSHHAPSGAGFAGRTPQPRPPALRLRPQHAVAPRRSADRPVA